MPPDTPRTALPVIALIGCGKMGSALLRGWCHTQAHDTPLFSALHVLDPQGIPPKLYGELQDELRGTGQDSDTLIAHTSADTLPPAAIIVLAVKPQIMAEACYSLKPALRPDTLVLSIAAGQSLTAFAGYFGQTQPVIRAMPNTPAAIGQGISVAVPNGLVSAAQKEQARRLLAAAGAVEWVDDEALMDAVTALSGSGPAYLFYLMDVLAQAGAKHGLPAPLARTLARQTMIGSAALAAAAPDISAETLRINVTSPGGTTEAALNVLMTDERLQRLFDDALDAAIQRSRALSGQ